jgi:hypothetical protein
MQREENPMSKKAFDCIDVLMTTHTTCTNMLINMYYYYYY